MSEILDAANQVVEYATQKKYQEQKNACEKYLKKVLDTKKADVRVYRAFFYAGLMDAYLKLEQYDRVGPIFKKALNDQYCNEFAKTYFYGCMSIAASYRGVFDEARECADCYKAGLNNIMQHEELVQEVYFIRDACTLDFYEKVDDAIYRDARPINQRAGLDAPLKLSISLMTSNRKDTIRKCLDSMQHLREVVPSELVIVDTGCDEEMRRIIEGYTDKIVKFEWCNDFAAARNAGLALCTGNWFLFIDDDEWFENTDDIEEFFMSGEYRNYEKAFYGIRNYGDKAGKTYADNEVLRICQLTEETHFRSRIHEVLQPYYDKGKHLKSFVHHFGYAFDTEEERIRHGYRNIIPMKDAVEREPYDTYMKIHLAHGYYNTDEYHSLEVLCEKTIKQINAMKSDDVVIWRIYCGFCSGYIYALCQMGFYEKAMECSDTFLAKSLTGLAQITIYRWKAYAAYKSKNVEQCMDAVEHYEQLMEVFKENPERFYVDRMHMTEAAVHEENAISMIKDALRENVYYEPNRQIARRENYRQMVQLEKNGSDDCQLAKLYYIEGELCMQEAFCKQHLEQSVEDYAFYRLGYVDAIFTQCRYEVALKEIDLALQDDRLLKSDCIMLYCEGCISAFRQENYTLAHHYGKLYQSYLSSYGDEINIDNLFLVASVQKFNQEKIQEIMDSLITQGEKDANDEMIELAKQIKERAKKMIEDGELIAAQSVLSQLLAIMPNDEETKHLLEKCL